MQGSLKVDNNMFIMEAITRGLGLRFIPDFVCKEAIASGEVLEVLPESIKPMLTLYALYPARQFVPAKLVQCIEYLEQWFAEIHKP